jgi:hypothetical protein
MTTAVFKHGRGGLWRVDRGEAKCPTRFGCVLQGSHMFVLEASKCLLVSFTWALQCTAGVVLLHTEQRCVSQAGCTQYSVCGPLL